jgi:hypothetical protein
MNEILCFIKNFASKHVSDPVQELCPVGHVAEELLVGVFLLLMLLVLMLMLHGAVGVIA